MSSFPSKKVTLVDVPGVRSPSAKFEYNFFVPDEMINDTGIPRIEDMARSGEFQNSKLLKAVARFSPRDVKINFIPPKLQAQGNEFISNGGQTFRARDIKLENYINRIYDERSFSNANFTGLNLQDTGIDGKLFFYTSGSIASRVDAKNRKLTRRITNITNNIYDTITTDSFSLLDAAKSLNEKTPDSVTGKFLVDALNNVQTLGALFADDTKKTELTNSTYDRIKEFTLKSQINDKVLADVLKTIATDPTSIYADEAAQYLPIVKKLQKKAAMSGRADEISLEEYEVTVEPITYRPVDISTFQPKSEIVGYIIDKTEITKKGKFVKRDPVIVNSPISTTAIDTKIKYNSTYSYSIKAVVLLEMLANSPESGDIVAASFLISSEPSRKMKVQCVENVPPPPPTDVKSYWDADTEKMTLSWAYPVNTQRDVKRFQVFRRLSIMNAFQLIQEFNFDDSIIQTKNLENPTSNRVKKTKTPIMLYTDHDFTKDNTQIYSVCAFDAHGMTSNYSAQFEISFDKSKNKLKQKMISVSGAPKSYPNMHIDNDLFEDTIRTTGKKKMTVHFSPEYLDVFRRDGGKYDLLATDKNSGNYRIQIINTDMQKASFVDIDLKNLCVNT